VLVAGLVVVAGVVLVFVKTMFIAYCQVADVTGQWNTTWLSVILTFGVGSLELLRVLPVPVPSYNFIVLVAKKDLGHIPSVPNVVSLNIHAFMLLYTVPVSVPVYLTQLLFKTTNLG
jgi:hypothetical protein